MRDIDLVAVHCAATPNGKPFDVTDIRKWHTEPPNNWSDCGYHYVIRVDGEIECGRMETVIGAHIKGKNNNSIGICMIGTDVFSDEQYAALKKLLTDLLDRYPNAEIHGHYEFDSHKTCPCFDVASWAKQQGIVA